MSEGENSGLIAGLSFPLEYIAGYYMRLHTFTPLAELVLDNVGPPGLMGAYALANVELPNPDVEPHQRIITLPIKHKSDYKSLYRANIDSGVKAGTNELVLLYEHRRGFWGGLKPSLHVAAYPAGTWSSFFEVVSHYAVDQFRWPVALFLYQPSSTQAFPSRGNIFST
jgi:hypothetical protein